MSALTVKDRRFETHSGRKLVHGFDSPVSSKVEFTIVSQQCQPLCACTHALYPPDLIDWTWGALSSCSLRWHDATVSALTVRDRRFESHPGRKFVHRFDSPVSSTVDFNIISLSFSSSPSPSPSLCLSLSYLIFDVRWLLVKWYI